MGPGDKIVFCCGLHSLPDTTETAGLWAAFSPLARKYPYTFTLAKQLLCWFWGHFQYNRLQAAVRPDWSEAVRFVERLGFSKEMIMEKYGPQGEDYALYALLRKEVDYG